jgi:two-component system, NtrC family, sensor histidine kinase HydH
MIHRADLLFEAQLEATYRQTDRMFVLLLLFEWVAAFALALLVSPYAWAGSTYGVHVHVAVAALGGLAINSLPVLLASSRPGALVTRCSIAVAQMLWSSLLIHLSGGRLETHFHVFGSLAFLAFYRDWRVLVPATLVVAADHGLRQAMYPESVYGIANPEWWRFLEHAGWVVFEDVILVWGCVRGTNEVRDLAERQAQVEALSARDLENLALREQHAKQAAIVHAEKQAAIQLAASVGHELRNPLAAILNAHVYVTRRIAKGGDLTADPRVAEFNALIEREIAVCGKLISDLLDFARERAPTLAPCPLRPLVSDAMSVVPQKPEVTLVNAVPDGLPIPTLDRDQFRQVITNLVQNASEAMPEGRGGRVEVAAELGGSQDLRIVVRDDGAGMPPDVIKRIFQPLFTTKTKGTGLGLAIVSTIVSKHKGTIGVHSVPGQGTTFTIQLPTHATA